MPRIPEITQPTLLVDVSRVRQNIARMADKAAQANIAFRPHFKTHQSDYIGELYRQAGVSALCASSVDMAEYFADAGWRDITLLVPANWRQIARINALAARVNLGLHVESVVTARFLSENLTQDADIWIEIDSGRKRTGVSWQDTALVKDIAAALGGHAHLRGILTFAGQSYGAKTPEAAAQVYDETEVIMAGLRDMLKAEGHARVEISVGDTPSCSAKETLYGADEIRPGTLVFYDVMQTLIGACGEDDIAIAMGCPVVAKYPERGEIVVYGGAVHFSRDWVKAPDGTTIFGWVTTFNEDGWNPAEADCYVADLSQEIGTIRASPSLMARVQVGDVLAVLPVHCCLTVDAMREFTTLDGETYRCMPLKR